MEFRGTRRVNKPLCVLFSSYYYTPISVLCQFIWVIWVQGAFSFWLINGARTVKIEPAAFTKEIAGNFPAPAPSIRMCANDRAGLRKRFFPANGAYY